jgi:hypothetical protein
MPRVVEAIGRSNIRVSNGCAAEDVTPSLAAFRFFSYFSNV